MANLVYNRGKAMIAQQWLSTQSVLRTLNVMLVSTAYTADQDHNTVDDNSTSDPKSYECDSTGGYARTTITPTVYEDDTNEFAYWDAADTTFLSVTTGTAIGGAVIYIYTTSGGTTSDTGQDLLSYYSFASPITPNGGNITIQWAATSNGGVLKFGTTT